MLKHVKWSLVIIKNDVDGVRWQVQLRLWDRWSCGKASNWVGCEVVTRLSSAFGCGPGSGRDDLGVHNVR